MARHAPGRPPLSHSSQSGCPENASRVSVDGLNPVADRETWPARVGWRLGFLSRQPSLGAIVPALRLVAALEPQGSYRASNERGALGFRRIRINANCLLRGGERHQSLQGGHHFINMGMSKRICESAVRTFSSVRGPHLRLARKSPPVMLQNLSNQIRDCYRHAEECRQLSQTALSAPAIQEYLDMERR